MKKALFILLAIMLTFGLAACGSPKTALSPSMETAAETLGIVAFADPVLEARVRAAMGRPEGDITAAEAEAVTEMNFGIDWQMDAFEGTQITDLDGLECFKNLQSLNLASNAVTDLSPLARLDKLTSLILAGNPVADISPLSGMTSLEKLSLSGCAAQDYSPLKSLTSLKALMLDDSAITDLGAISGLTGLTYLSLARTQVSDVSPLAALTGLKQLYLAECPVADYLPLAGICPNLEKKDFTVPSSLEELGFTRPDNSVWANYTAGSLSVNINHSEWGIPEMDMEADTIRLSLVMDGGTGLTVGCDPAGNKNYVFSISQNGEHIADYIYVSSEDSLLFDGDRERVENAIRTILGDTSSGDILLEPISFFNDTIRETFVMTADALFALPFAPPTLLNLGFVANEANAVCLYEDHEGTYVSIEVNRPEWGQKEYDVRFFTPIKDYGDSVMGLIVMYDTEQKRFHVAGYLNENSYAEFDYDAEDGSVIDGSVSGADSVKDYFTAMYDDPAITDIYTYSVQLVEGYIYDTFGMSIDALYALPVE